MSKDQTTQPTPRILIGPATEPNPPWTNKYFDCACGARFQFGCADELKELPSMDFESRRFEALPCWSCGKVNVIKIPRDEPEGYPS
jgi:hypothetical protein